MQSPAPEQPASALIPLDPESQQLAHAEMDATHREFITLVNRLGVATGNEFIQLFQELHRHTGRHFAQEYQLMQESGFPALAEHHADHQRILGQLEQFQRRVAQGRSKLARAFVCEQLPDWFRSHLAMMDSALAAHLKG